MVVMFFDGLYCGFLVVFCFAMIVYGWWLVICSMLACAFG